MQLGSSPAPLPPVERIGRLTTDQYFRMIESGIIKEGSPYELLDGLIVLKDRSTRGEDIMSIGGPHNYVVGLISELNSAIKGRGCFVQSQGPIRIPPLQAPEPDGAIVRGKRSDFKTQTPHASDIVSVIEVSDSSLDLDRRDKRPKYAEAGIPQFVLINLVDREIEIYESPQVSKRDYSQSRIAKPGDNVDFLLADGTRLSVPVIDLLP